jgi:hypothetical protein
VPIIPRSQERRSTSNRDTIESLPDTEQHYPHTPPASQPPKRACNEKNDKGKLCVGHLKRWYFFGEEVKQKLGPDVEIYRCEHCKALYLPNPDEEPRSSTLCY